ncbi:Penicillin-binding protein 2 [Curvibacter sp. AEP1-3]|jgi:penicillin-binding protein 2|uniref:Peptidoglycan D,D-transpeptidase MrdA n=1 Tax=Curvibacter symbiont subsp. Hydra magnipapillata TaxID=667019 RepID=C9Y6X5_CURXX|nr:penicillin-binding protein 2 [Curvibacter sp. AEP1-3]ARV19241.1 Penicillin-binding protein 2 [Curvibacter sp. AEP1-3]CBA26635.1 Penicillin-binding protein 2 [Curvibacter putative symbiont of Hydra magnipapillata]
MTELRNVQADLARFRTRVFVVSVLVLVCFFLLFARLVYLQIFRHDDLRAQAESNRTSIVPIVPNRGLIVDRNGIVLATNYSAYTLEITPSKSGGVEETLDELSKVVDITPRDRRRFKKLMEESKSFESLPIRTRLTDTEVARFAAQRFRFPGVEIKARLFRNYPYGDLASHVIGYIGRINRAEKEKIDDSEDQANYRGTEYIGKLGVEQSFESVLHGITGVERIETSAGGRAVRKLASNPSTPGNVVVLSIDIKLQKLIEDMFGTRRGALVALDPKTGEVLAFVSKPTFDSNLFVEGIDQENWQMLNESIDKPLLNRALRGTYPPGSTYKPFMAMAALETGTRTPQTLINDPGFYMFGGNRFGSPENERGGIMDMRRAIVESSNVYFYSLANELGVDTMHDFMAPLGFGQITGIDINGEVRGVLPSQAWKRKYYKRPEQQKWYAGETISLGIGQGYNSFTMLQIAQAVSTLANNGVKHKPQLVTATQDATTRVRTPVAPEPPIDLAFKPENLKVVKDAMVGVTQGGTGTRVFAGAGYVSGGKTGTAQAVSLAKNQKYNASTMEEHQRDHSLYVAFAPAEDPKIALAVIVENAGFGAAAAAPIARRTFDYWLLGQYPSEEDLAAVSQGKATAPIGKPRVAAELPWPPPR